MMRQYAYAVLSRWDFCAFRLLGPGLGNLLFPWARMVVAAGDQGLSMLWPTWPQIKMGPVLRRDSDTRFYAGLFRNPGDYIDGLEKLWIRMSARYIEEPVWRSSAEKVSNLVGGVVCFKGMDGLFGPILQHRKTVREELIRMTRPEHLTGLSHDFSQSITVHIRLGDFQPFDNAKMRSGAFNVRLSLKWVMETIHRLREGLGEGYPVWVFSDGSDKDLRDLLALQNVKRLHFGSALADMLAMSRSRALIVSSTFSMWSAYLGAVPSIYYPGQLRQRLIDNRDGWEMEREPGEGIGRVFLDVLSRNMRMVV